MTDNRNVIAKGELRRPFWGRLANWSTAAAVVLAVLSVLRFVTWGNHWYVAEQLLAPSASGSGDALWKDLYGLLRSGNQALASGLIMLVVAGAFAGLAGLARRRC